MPMEALKLLECWWPKGYEFKIFWSNGDITYANYGRA